MKNSLEKSANNMKNSLEKSANEYII